VVSRFHKAEQRRLLRKIPHIPRFDLAADHNNLLGFVNSRLPGIHNIEGCPCPLEDSCFMGATWFTEEFRTCSGTGWIDTYHGSNFYTLASSLQNGLQAGENFCHDKKGNEMRGVYSMADESMSRNLATNYMVWLPVFNDGAFWSVLLRLKVNPECTDTISRTPAYRSQFVTPAGEVSICQVYYAAIQASDFHEKKDIVKSIPFHCEWKPCWETPTIHTMK
jgi:hypothetical protein